MKQYLCAKIHKGVVTEANLAYVGSITIDKALMDMVGIEPYEKVMVVSNTTGMRLETYTIEAPAGSHVLCMNGAAAHLIKKGEEIIIMAFALSETPIAPKQILLDEKNVFVRYL
jgi:aspartate 1-decarboxylase